MKQPDHNLFAALRAAFPADLDAVAVGLRIEKLK